QGCQLWTVGDWQLTRRFARASFAFSPDGRLLATDDNLGQILLAEPETGREVLRLTGPEPSRYVPGCFTPDGSRLIGTDAASGNLYVWGFRLIGKGARGLALDGEGDECPPEGVPPAPLTVRLDTGVPP